MMKLGFRVGTSFLARSFQRDPVTWSLSLAVALLHLMVAGRYDIFRNELYFIVCGRHPAFGYVDQPPLVPLLCAVTQIFGNNPWLLRIPAVIAAVAIVPVTTAFIRLLGGTTIWLGALAVAVAPVLLGLTATLNTSTFEPLAWLAVSYFITRALLLKDRSALLWAGLVAGISLEAKYGILIWAIGLAAGLLLTDSRKILAWRELWVGLLITFVFALPNFLWQAIHEFPFLELTRNSAGGKNLTGTPIEFLVMQIMEMNPILAPLWMAGMVGTFFLKKLRPVRFLSIATLMAAAVVWFSHGKDYYLSPVFPTLLVLGAVVFERLPRTLLWTWSSLIVLSSALAAPVVLPILEPSVLAAYLKTTHLYPKPDETPAIGAPLTQVFSDELGWRDFEKQVAAAYRSLPDRDQIAILAADYGEAAALDVYGPADGLPPALCAENNYYLWGWRGFQGRSLLHLNGDPERWKHIAAQIEIIGHFGAPYVMPYENHRPIILCHGLRRDLATLWPYLKRFR